MHALKVTKSMLLIGPHRALSFHMTAPESMEPIPSWYMTVSHVWMHCQQLHGASGRIFLQVMTRQDHSSVDGRRPVSQSNLPSTNNQQPASLGPVDPSWLAKLSRTLGIQPARTVAPLLMSIWPGVHPAAICCREACAYLMQVCSAPCTLTTTQALLVHQ